MSRKALIGMFVLAVLTGTLFVTVFWVRSYATAKAQSTICRKVDVLDSALIHIVAKPADAPKPGEYGYAYWRAHHRFERIGAPGSPARSNAVEDAIKELRSAACSPANLPKGTP